MYSVLLNSMGISVGLQQDSVLWFIFFKKWLSLNKDVTHHGHSPPLQLVPAGREWSLVCDIMVYDWGIGWYQIWLYPFRGARCRRAASMLISSHTTETPGRSVARAGLGKKKAFTAPLTFQHQLRRIKVPLYGIPH